MLPDELCEESFCCKVMDGPDVGSAYASTWDDCEAAGNSVVYDGYCDQTVCCATDDGPGRCLGSYPCSLWWWR